ncbi:hypothetical protein FRB90_003041 [Tulasnella sp. 427]|nr:hypothetical protein FRB90_003041 [Tulasnella sp. 427]
MSASFQRGTETGAEPGHPIQAPTDKKVADQGISETAHSRPDIAGSDSAADKPAAHEDYPEQKHAGKVGYGPNFAEARGKVTMGEKIDGLKEEVKGKIKKDEHMIQEGHDKRTGELKRRQMEEENNPKAFAGAKPDESKNPGNAPADHQSAERQGSNVGKDNINAEQRKSDEDAKDHHDRQVEERVGSQVNVGDRSEMPQ